MPEQHRPDHASSTPGEDRPDAAQPDAERAVEDAPSPDAAQADAAQPDAALPDAQGLRPLTAALFLAAMVAAGWWNPFLVGTIMALMAVIAVHELGHLTVARRAGLYTPEFMVGFGPTVWSTRRGETTWGLKAIPLGGYVRIIGMTASEQVDPDYEERAYRNAPWRWKVAVAAAGPMANLALAVVLLVGVLVAFGQVVPSPSARIGGVVAEVAAGTPAPAAAAGLRPGDVVVAVDGEPVSGWDGMSRHIEDSAGRPLELTVQRDGGRVGFEVTPARSGERWVLGVTRDTDRERLSPLAAVGESVRTVWGTVTASVGALGTVAANFGDYLRDLFSGRQVANESRFLSPVGASQVARSMAENGVADVLGFAALINIMLGVFNLLPVPPLDGGHIVVATVERVLTALRRRPVRVPARVLAPISYSVWALLLMIGLSALWLDVVSPVRL